MELKNTHVGPMTNGEVLAVLKKQMEWHQEVQRQHPRHKEMPKDNKMFPTVWINQETTSYLMDTAAAKQTRDDVKALVQGITKIDSSNKLTRLQKLSIINLRPTTEALLYAIVPQCRHWFTADKIKELLSCIAESLPDDSDDEEDDDDEDDDDLNDQ